MLVLEFTLAEYPADLSMVATANLALQEGGCSCYSCLAGLLSACDLAWVIAEHVMAPL